MCKSGCGGLVAKGKDKGRPAWMMPGSLESLTHLCWAPTRRRASGSGQVIHFQRGSDYYLIAGGLWSGREMESLEYLGKLEPPLGSHLFSGGTSAPSTTQAAGNMQATSLPGPVLDLGGCLPGPFPWNRCGKLLGA